MLGWLEVMLPECTLPLTGSPDAQVGSSSRTANSTSTAIRRHLNGRFVVTVKHDGDAAAIQPVDRCCQEVARDALHDILDERRTSR